MLQREGYRFRGEASLLTVAIAVGICMTASSRAHADRVTTGAAVKRAVTVRQKASVHAKAVGKLLKSRSAALIGTTTGWQRVRLDDGTEGYVSAAWTSVVREPLALSAADTLVVTFIDVGQGDAILLQLGAVDILVDTGPVTAWHENLRKSLASVQSPLDMLFITHPHDDHYGGAKDVLDALDVRAVYTNGERRGPPRDAAESASWQAVESAVAGRHVTIQSLEEGEVLLPAPGLTIRVLAAGGQYPDKPGGSFVNNDSLVLMVEFAGRQVLLTGDIETEADRSLVKKYCDHGTPTTCPSLHADVLKVPHHGSANFDAGFYTAVKPAWAVVSAGYRNETNCLPRLESVAALHAIGTKVGSTSADGVDNIVLRVDSKGAMSWTWPAQKAFAWSRAGGAHSACKPESYVQGQ